MEEAVITDYDVVVVGAGIAGATAGLFAARHGHSTLVLNGGLPGGQLLNITAIEDFPGFPIPVSGFELGPGSQQQAAEAGAVFRQGEADSIAEGADSSWAISIDGDTLSSRSVVVATGSSPRKLGLDGEERLAGRGISECASCDGPLYNGGRIGVVGGGDSALQESLELTQFGSEVHVFHRGPELTGQATYRDRVLASDKIQVHFNTVVEGIVGEDRLEAVRLRELETGSAREMELSGLFVYVGSQPQSSFLPEALELDDRGRIPTDIWMRTVMRGLLAAGDIRSDSASQAISAAGDGATAAVAAHHYLTGGQWR